MTSQIEDLALSLPREDRARLTKRLIDSLDEKQEFEEEWADEIEKRLVAYSKGEVALEDIRAELD